MTETPFKSRILVVDDAPENIQIAMEILKEDYAIVAATNGEKALSIVAQDNPPELILLDIMMPGMDGYAVLRRLKEDSQTAHIPVIMISALDQVGTAVQCIEDGAMAYLVKPFEPEALKKEVAAALGKKPLQEKGE